MRIDRKGFLKLASIPLAVAGRKLLGAAQKAATAANALRGQRWAMVVDIARCAKDQGCDDCIRACHRVHNVPKFTERAREVKWIWKEPFEMVFPHQRTQYSQTAWEGKPAMVFCNHCERPPCVRVCPTQATWKRPDGIVMMDWHRCIGCRYCVAACPYGSRSFNWVDPRPRLAELNPDFPTRTKGVVEKCTFCDERLAKGQPPACVEACKEKALAFGDLGDAGSAVRELLRTRYTIRRKPELGTEPEVYYII